jgi:hypothetical protein
MNKGHWEGVISEIDEKPRESGVLKAGKVLIVLKNCWGLFVLFCFSFAFGFYLGICWFGVLME